MCVCVCVCVRGFFTYLFYPPLAEEQERHISRKQYDTTFF